MSVILCNQAKAEILNFFVNVKTDLGYAGVQHVGVRQGISSIDDKTYELLQKSKSFKLAVENGTIIVNDRKKIAEYQEARAHQPGKVDNRSELVKVSAETQKLKHENEKLRQEMESLKQLVIESTGKSADKKNANTREVSS